MDPVNIEILYTYFFRKDGITKDHIYESCKKYKYPDGSIYYNFQLKTSFIQYVEQIKNRFSFYKFCRSILKRDKIGQPEREKEIIQEIRNSDTEYDENDLEDADFIYDWYLDSRVNYYLFQDLHFFLNIVDKIN